jgi:hypothetical protein
MPVGDCQKAFRDAASSDGVQLEERRHDWLTQRGHLELLERVPEVARLLREIFHALGGDEALLAGARQTLLPNDYFHVPTRTLVEVDELQHFTSARALTLSMYPADAVLGFDLAHYKSLCAEHAVRADRQYAHRSARCFGDRGRQRQRAYNDALRDLAAPALGHPGVIRAAAPDRGGTAAWSSVRSRLLGERASRQEPGYETGREYLDRRNS